MFNNRTCPQTPAPRKDVPRFPMSAAILETPSIMSSFRELKQPNHTANPPHQPTPKQFIMSYSSSATSKGCAEKSIVYQQGPSSKPNLNTSQFLNGSFLDFSFSSNYTASMSTNRKVPLASNGIHNLNTRGTYKSESSTSSSTVGLKNFHRPSTLSGSTNLNDISHSYTGTRFSHEKRKQPAEHSVSKYSKATVANIPRGSTVSADSPDRSSSSQNAKTSSLRILSGTIEHLQKAIREQGKQFPLLLETVANVVSIKPGPRVKEKVILLRHRNQGPVMQGIFYEIDHDLAPVAPGDLVRCVGRLQPVGSRLQILNISRTTEQYGRTIMRLQTVSAFASKRTRAIENMLIETLLRQLFVLNAI